MMRLGGLLLGLWIGLVSVWAAPQILPKIPPFSCAYLFRDSPNQAQDQKRQLKDVEEIVLVSQNFQNLFRWKDGKKPTKGPGNGVEEKPEWQRKSLAKYLDQNNADIIVGTEIDDVTTGQTFSDQYWNGRYLALGREGNDSRGIDIVFFVKKDLELDITLESRKEDQLDHPGHEGFPRPLFARDLPALLIRKKGAPPDSTPDYIVLGVHLKSKRPAQGELSESELRGFELQRIVEVKSEYEKRYPGVPIIFSGDHNESLASGDNIKKYVKGKLHNAVEGLKNVKKAQEGTHAYFPKEGPSELNIIDGHHLNDAALELGVEVEVLPFVGKDGSAKRPPQSYEDREKNYASDHAGSKLILDNKKRQLQMSPK